MKHRKAQTMSVTLAEGIESIGAAAGQTIQLSLSPSDVAVQEELDTFLAGYSNYQFRADEVAPPFLVDRDTDKFRLYSSNDAFERVQVESSMQAGVNQVDPRTELGEYRVVDRALGNFMPTRIAANAKFDIKAGALRRVRVALDLDREIRVWNLLTTAGNWNANNVVAAGNPFNDPTTNPIQLLREMMNRSSQPISAFWMTPDTSFDFLDNPNTKTFMRQMSGDATQPRPVQGGGFVQDQSWDYSLPGMPPIRVAPAKVKNDSTGALEDVMGRDFVVGVTAPTETPGVPTSGQEIQTIQTFRTRGPSGTGFTTREFFVEERGLEGGTMMVAGHSEDVKFISNTAGCLLTGVNP